ncbi:MAG: peptidoglycan bridge formation glycyltransferase FemA/FemB family protein [Candidatus Spechtbacterales bacterium]
MSFLNSPQWRAFQESAGRETFNIGEGYALKLGVQFGKNYLYSNFSEIPKYLKEIKKIAKKENAIFFKWEPMMERQATSDKRQELEKLGFRKAQKELQPQKTVIIDIKKDDDEILSKMHKKTRYNIRLAEKRGVSVKESEDKIKDIGIFWELLQETAERDKFYTHPKEYYEKLIELDMAKLYFAHKSKQVHAVAIVIFYKKRATYLHGASSYEHRRDMAPYMLHFKIMQEAKTENLKEYDLWGIDEDKWPGMTRFKRGLGGREVEYIGSWDMPFNTFWYKAHVLKNRL